MWASGLAEMGSGMEKDSPRKGTKKRTGKKRSKSEPKTDGCPGGGRPKKTKEVVEGLIEKIEAKLSEQEVKATVGDFVRLLQLQKELEEGQPREVTVTWVERSEKEPSKEK